jgi:hypothetical protein
MVREGTNAILRLTQHQRCVLHVQPSDRFGSPSSEDLDAFVREFGAAFEEALGEELAGAVSVEVSSPVSAQPAASVCARPVTLQPQCACNVQRANPHKLGESCSCVGAEAFQYLEH